MTVPSGFVNSALPPKEFVVIFNSMPISANAFVRRSPCSLITDGGMLVLLYQSFSAQSAISSSIRRQKLLYDASVTVTVSSNSSQKKVWVYALSRGLFMEKCRWSRFISRYLY